MLSPMTTASLYCRLSAASDADNTGLHSQEADLRALAARHGLQVVAVHTDDGLSGALRDRPAFLAWLDDARSGRADHLLAWKLDRVSRGGPAGIARFLDVLDGLDADGRRASEPVRFLSHADGLDSASPAWLVQASVMSAIAHAEREAIRGRILRYQTYNRSVGRVVGGSRPWALQAVPREGGGKRYVPIPERAEGVRWALAHLRSGGSVAGVGREWLARGLLPARGTPQWYPSGLRYVLTSPALYGATVHRGKVLREDDGTVRIDPEQAVLTYAEHLELVALLDARAVHRPDPSAEPALLDRLLTCQSCGRIMYAHRPRSGATGYRCRGIGCTAPVSIGAHLAEPPIVAAYLDTLGPLEVLASASRAPGAAPEELARVREALDDVGARLAETDDDDEGLLLLRQRRDLRERLAALQDAASSAPILAPLVGAGRTYAEEWEAAEAVRDRNRLLRGAWQTVEVAPGRRGGPYISGAARLTFVD